MSSEPLRFDWFQSATEVCIDIFARNIKSETLQVEWTQRQVRVSFLRSEDEKPCERFFSLYADIEPKKSSYQLGRVKLELRLYKVDTSLWWDSLEAGAKKEREEKAAEKKGEEAQPIISTGPQYPSSSRIKHDWSRLELELEKEEKDKPESIDDFFKKLYANASDETRRAMVKSFVESKGTVLSTNWNEVAKQPVKPASPEASE